MLSGSGTWPGIGNVTLTLTKYQVVQDQNFT